MDKSPDRFGSVFIPEYMSRLFRLSTLGVRINGARPPNRSARLIYLDSAPLGIIPLKSASESTLDLKTPQPGD